MIVPLFTTFGEISKRFAEISQDTVWHKKNENYILKASSDKSTELLLELF